MVIKRTDLFAFKKRFGGIVVEGQSKKITVYVNTEKEEGGGHNLSTL